MAKHKAYTAPARQKAEAGVKQEDETSYESASQSAADFVQSVEPIQKRKKKARFIRKVILVILLVALIGAGGYFLFQAYDKDSSEPKVTQSSSQSEAETESETGTTTIESYASDNLNLTFDHPSNWQVDESQQNTLTIESPETEFMDATGQATSAKVVISIVPTIADMDDFPTDQATAVRESEKTAYDSPAAGQREETFLSFMNLDGPSDGLNAIYITGDSGYVKGDPVTKADFESVEPIVGVRLLAAGEPITISSEAWGNDQTLASVLAILKSLNIK